MVDNTTEVMDIWKNITQFTSRADAYFGHEIFEILDLITLLLDRQGSEIKMTRMNTNSCLTMQINSSRFGAETVNNLISHDAQWDQLNNVIILVYVSIIMYLKNFIHK